MPQWFVTEPEINLYIRDTPLSYQPSRGYPVAATLTYKEATQSRDSFDNYDMNVFSVGWQWHFSWRSYVEVDGEHIYVYTPNGRAMEYPADGSIDFQTEAALTPEIDGYTLAYPDGASDYFGYKVAGVWGSAEVDRYFLSWKSDPHGNKTQFQYTVEGAVVKLTQITDVDGSSTTISYTNKGPFAALITSIVSSRINATNTLMYSEYGELTNIVDVAGIVSGLTYGAERNLTSLVTPYGTTRFFFYLPDSSDPAYRSLKVVEPNQAIHLYLAASWQETDIVPSTDPSVPSTQGSTFQFENTFDNAHLNLNNSYYWGPRQYGELSSGIRDTLAADDEHWMDSVAASDLKMARRRHWLGYNQQLISPVLALEREPSPDGKEEGLTTWYDHGGKPENEPQYVGTNGWPRFVAIKLPNGESRFTRLSYNSLGHPTEIIETYTALDGTCRVRTNTFEYSSNNFDLKVQRDAVGVAVVSNIVDQSTHLLLAGSDALGQTTRYTYNGKGQRTGAVFPTGLVVTNQYYATGSYSDWLEKAITYEETPSGPKYYFTNRFTYSAGNLNTLEDARGLVVTNFWDALGRLTGQVFPDGTSITNSYHLLSGIAFPDSSGCLEILERTASKDRNGNWTYFTYDQMGQVTAITNALTNVTTLHYCDCGSLEWISNSVGDVTAYFYDHQGRLTDLREADETVRSFYYTQLGQIEHFADELGTTSRKFNNQGLLIATTNAFGRLFQALYDIRDRGISQTNRNGLVFTNTYDDLGRIRTRTVVGAGTETFKYSARGLTNYVNELATNTWFAYDALARRTHITNSNSTVLKFGYNPAGDLSTLTNELNYIIRWNYDKYGRLTNKVDQTGTEILRFAYDPLGRLTNRWSKEKLNTDYTYDAVGNLRSIDYSDDRHLTFAYDQANRLTNMLDAVGITGFTYADGQLVAEDGPWDSDTVAYRYGLAGVRETMSVSRPSASDWMETYQFDASWRLASVSSPVGVLSYTHHPGVGSGLSASTLVRKLQFPNGSYITNAFDGVARLTSTELRNSSHIKLNSHSYEYDKAHQRKKQTRTDGDYIEYTYNSLGQLVSATGKETGGTVRLNQKLSYGYDATGNLLKRTNDALVQTLVVDSRNQLSSGSRAGTMTVAGTTEGLATSVTVNGLTADRYIDHSFARAGITLVNGNNTFTAIANDNLGRSATNTSTVWLPTTLSFAYDQNGNITGDGRRIFEYDAENQLTNVTIASVSQTQLVYDGLGRLRIRREFAWQGGAFVPNGETRYIYDGMRVVQERNGDNLPTVEYTRGVDLSGSLEGAGGIGGLLALSRLDCVEPTPAFYHADGNGNITALINSKQAIVAQYLYDSFGNLLAQSGSWSDLNRVRFSSKEHIPSIGLYYYGYRFYDPNLQRWINRDPLGEFADLNLYRFSYNAPLNYVDSDGLTPEGRAVGTVIGGVIGAGFGGTLGAGIGALGGAAGGSGVAPGPGTAAGAIGGAGVGGTAGAIIGGVVGGILGGNLGDAISDSLNMARHESGQRNYINDIAAEEARRTGRDVCDVLRDMMKQARCDNDTKKQREIKQAQKAAGCRQHN